MQLHKDRKVFAELVGIAAESIGLPQIYVEKDDWVTKALKFLSESQPVYRYGVVWLSYHHHHLSSLLTILNIRFWPIQKHPTIRFSRSHTSTRQPE